jgi:PBP1b-binding outer membrane lipoprotein LpoB
MKRIYTYITLVLLLVIGCSTAKTYTLEEQRKERETSKKEARQQVEDAKTLQP